MAYRNDVDALEARLAALQGDVKATTKARDEVAALLDEARARAATDGLAADWAAGGPQRRRRRRVWIGVTVGGLALVSSLVTIGLTRPRADPFKKVMTQFGVFTDEMCLCRDKECAQKVSEAMTQWSQEMAKEEPGPPHLTEDQMKAASEMGERMGKCMMTAMADKPAEVGPQDGNALR